MALILLGSIVTKISGKLGGHSFNSSRYGSSVKTIGQHNATPSIKQSAQRVVTSSISSKYRSLTDLDKAAWENEAVNYPYKNRVGEVKYYPGYILHNKLNQGLLSIGQDYTPKPLPFVAMVDAVNEVTDFTTVSMLVEYSNVSNDFLYEIFATPSLSKGISNPYKYMKKINTYKAVDLQNGVDIIADYANVYGGPVVDSTIFIYCRAVVFTTGSQSNNLILSSDVVDV